LPTSHDDELLRARRRSSRPNTVPGVASVALTELHDPEAIEPLHHRGERAPGTPRCFGTSRVGQSARHAGGECRTPLERTNLLHAGRATRGRRRTSSITTDAGHMELLWGPHDHARSVDDGRAGRHWSPRNPRREVLHWAGDAGPACEVATRAVARLAQLRTARAVRAASFGGLQCRTRRPDPPAIWVRPRGAWGGCWSTPGSHSGRYFFWQLLVPPAH
jgi:hypothetical protein